MAWCNLDEGVTGGRSQRQRGLVLWSTMQRACGEILVVLSTPQRARGKVAPQKHSEASKSVKIYWDLMKTTITNRQQKQNKANNIRLVCKSAQQKWWNGQLSFVIGVHIPRRYLPGMTNKGRSRTQAVPLLKLPRYTYMYMQISLMYINIQRDVYECVY